MHLLAGWRYVEWWDGCTMARTYDGAESGLDAARNHSQPAQAGPKQTRYPARGFAESGPKRPLSLRYSTLTCTMQIKKLSFRA